MFTNLISSLLAIAALNVATPSAPAANSLAYYPLPIIPQLPTPPYQPPIIPPFPRLDPPVLHPTIPVCPAPQPTIRCVFSGDDDGCIPHNPKTPLPVPTHPRPNSNLA